MAIYDTGTLGGSLFDDWLALCDAKMPPPLAVRSAGYRRFLATLIGSIPESNRGVLSIGAGTGVMEEKLQEMGIDIVANDTHPRAVEICRAKNLRTLEFNFMQEKPPEGCEFGILYADGLLGHVWPEDADSLEVWYKLASIGAPNIIVTSNDIVSDTSPTRKVTGLPDQAFFRPPAGWYAQSAEKAGLRKVFSKRLPYRRRQAWRDREILVLSIGGQRGNI